MLQEIIVISIVIVAALFLIYKWWPKKKNVLEKSQGCSSGCGSCSVDKPTKFKKFS
ncbi:FeoB-associated Cys-rich membrane protein [Fluviispira multicolorata]|uniref:FeoB-associated Cys-rich membrane protein n=1 Tax=Fluviispira multicolorata TaxID=2654512 RepID=UPI001B86E15A|nr:FeoB-associated Cys-rich membrane protein [Fluviispira multicolorata]